MHPFASISKKLHGEIHTNKILTASTVYYGIDFMQSNAIKGHHRNVFNND